MKIEIIFVTAAKPKTIEAEDVYTKGALLCLQLPDGNLLKYPLCNVFSVAHPHGPHIGSTRKKL